MATFIQYQTKDSLYDGEFNDRVGWAAAGMGDVVVGENGGLIVIDGGNMNDAEGLAALLAKYAQGDRVEIDLWVITHPHLDHYGALLQISRDPALAAHIRIREIAWWFPPEFSANVKWGIHDAANAEVQEVCRVMGAREYRPARDEQRIVDDVTLQFLYVPEDCSILNTAGENSNLCSLIFTLQGKEKRVMVTGDAYERSMQVTAWRYGKSLKCDVLQMPHHALCDATCTAFYNFVDPQIVLEPISIAGYRAMHTIYARLEGSAGVSAVANLCLEARAEAVYKAFEGTAVLSI